MKKVTYIIILVFCFVPVFATQTQYIIITPAQLVSEATVIQNLHSAEVAQQNQLITDIVTLESIEAAYPSLASEQAIRSYLLNEIAGNPDLTFLMLLGDETLVPPITDYYGDISDDFYTSVNQYSTPPQLGTGRITVSDATTAAAVANKIRNYTLNNDNSSWHNRMVLFADDAYRQGGGSYYSEVLHVAQSDDIYQRMSSLLDISCYYGTEYVPLAGSGWPTMPELTNDVINAFNSGVAWMNYIGHGMETTLADELILDSNRDMSLISAPNYEFPVFVSGACRVGHYDGSQCLAEDLLQKTDGAIAVIAATRDVFSSNVGTLFDSLYLNIQRYMQDQNSYRMGNLVSASKAGAFMGSPLYYFQYFGDPAMLIPFPKVNSVVSTYPDPLAILASSEVTLAGNYQNDNSYITVKGPETDVTQIYGGVVQLNYTLPGETVFKSDFTSNVSFTAPLDMTYCDTCVASINVYVNSSSSGTSVNNLGGIPIIAPPGNITDVNGPDVTLQKQGTTLNNNDLIQPLYDLNVVLHDTSGINLMGVMGHNIRYWLDDEDNARSVTTAFTYNVSDQTTGSVAVSLASSTAGLHTLYVEAWDNANNRTLSATSLCFSDCTPYSSSEPYSWVNTTSLLNPSGIYLTTDGHVYAATEGGILQYDEASGSFTQLMNGTGLKNLDYSSMSVDAFGNLWLGGSSPDGSIQVYNPQYGLQKKINHLGVDEIIKFFISGTSAFASYQIDNDFEVMELRYDISNLPYFQNHYGNFPIAVSAITDVDEYGGYVYISTPDGVLKGNHLSDNLTASTNWTVIAATMNPIQFLAGTTQYLINDSGIWKNNAGVWQNVFSGLSGTVLDAQSITGGYAVLTTTRYYEFDANMSLSSGYPISKPGSANFSCFGKTGNEVVFGFVNAGISILNTQNMTHTEHIPNTLMQNAFTAVTVTSGNNLAGVSSSGIFLHTNGQYMHFIPTAQASSYPINDPSPTTFSGVSVNYTRGSNAPWSIVESQSGNLVVGNSGIRPSNPGVTGGLIEVNPQSFQCTVIDTTAGKLDGLAGIYNQYWNDRYLTIHHVKKDAAGNIWTVNPYSELYNHIAAIQMADGSTWHHVTAPDQSSYLPQEVAFDEFGRAWFGMKFDNAMNQNVSNYATGGLRVLNANGTLNDESDDTWISVLNENILPNISVWSLDFDSAGNLWVLTSAGVQGYEITEDYQGITLSQIIQAPVLSEISLYQGDHVRVDDADNVWITTQGSGVFILRNDLALWPDNNGFTVSNSSLLSNTV